MKRLAIGLIVVIASTAASSAEPTYEDAEWSYLIATSDYSVVKADNDALREWIRELLNRWNESDHPEKAALFAKLRQANFNWSLAKTLLEYADVHLIHAVIFIDRNKFARALEEIQIAADDVILAWYFYATGWSLCYEVEWELDFYEMNQLDP